MRNRVRALLFPLAMRHSLSIEMPTGMFKFLRNEWRCHPITMIWICLCLAYFAIFQYDIGNNDAELTRTFGAARLLKFRAIPELSGPFDLWDGQWLRLLANAFLHEQLWHLAGNVFALWLLGRLMETRVRRSGYIAFFLVAALGSMAAEFAIGNHPIGISGALLAVFGWLMVRRYQEEELGEILTEPFVGTSLILVILCVPITYVGLLNIANVAHFSGLGYGIVIALMTSWLRHRRKLQFVGLLLVHAIVGAAVYCSVRPVWLANYQWYAARMSESPEDQLKCLQRANEIDPNIPGVWLHRTVLLWQDDQFEAALHSTMSGLKANPTDSDLFQLTQELWNKWNSPDGIVRREQTLLDVFADESQRWRKKLKLDVAIAQQPTTRRNLRPTLKYDIRNLSSYSGLFESEESVPDVDPDAPSSAAEGAVL